MKRTISSDEIVDALLPLVGDLSVLANWELTRIDADGFGMSGWEVTTLRRADGLAEIGVWLANGGELRIEADIWADGIIGGELDPTMQSGQLAELVTRLATDDLERTKRGVRTRVGNKHLNLDVYPRAAHP